MGWSDSIVFFLRSFASFPPRRSVFIAAKEIPSPSRGVQDLPANLFRLENSSFSFLPKISINFQHCSLKTPSPWILHVSSAFSTPLRLIRLVLSRYSFSRRSAPRGGPRVTSVSFSKLCFSILLFALPSYSVKIICLSVLILCTRRHFIRA